MECPVYLCKDEKVIMSSDLAFLLGMTTKEINRFASKHLPNKKQLTKNEFTVFLNKTKIKNKGGHYPTVYGINDLKILKDIFTPYKKKNKNLEFLFVNDIIEKYKLIGFDLIKKELNLFGKRPDLLFKKENKFYVVEVMCGKLNKEHLYKSLEYRDLFLLKYNKTPEVHLICEKICEFYKKICKMHKVKYFVIPNNRTLPKPITDYFSNRREALILLINEINKERNPISL